MESGPYLNKCSHSEVCSSIQSQNQVVYPGLAKFLGSIDAEEAYDEMLEVITTHEAMDLKIMSVEEVITFLTKLHFLQPFTGSIVRVMHAECCDGSYLAKIDAGKWTEALSLPIEKFILLKIVLDGIVHGKGKLELLANPIHVENGENALVVAGVVADLSRLPAEQALALDQADRNCQETGEGYCYGQLIVLGFKEFHSEGGRDHWVGVGLPNEKLILKRRKVPNGITHLTAGKSAGTARGTQQNKVSHTIKLRVVPKSAPVVSQRSADVAVRVVTPVLPAARHSSPAPNSLPTASRPRYTQHRPAGATDLDTHTPDDIDMMVDSASYQSEHYYHSHGMIRTVSPLQTVKPAVISISCFHDPALDMYTIGRMPGNDLVVKGPLHADARKNGVLTGPVSRYACRILCERLPPFRCWLFAGGFDGNNEIVVGDSAPKFQVTPELDGSASRNANERRIQTCSLLRENSPDLTDQKSSPYDAMTTYGVRLWQPSTKQWTEISVLGQACSTPRPRMDLPGHLLDRTVHTNELVDGSIIDIAGVSFMFQSPSSMTTLLAARPVHPDDVIDSLNELKPQCPVMLQGIDFVFLDAKERALNEFRRLEREGNNFVKRLPFHVPFADYSHIEEDKRSMVFPACGHVHGYHRNLAGKPCPLCRTQGPYVPVAFAFESNICGKKPTHVFNPCGHVAARSTCEHWSSISMPDPAGAKKPSAPRCPFCTTRLSPPQLGGPFNRLILQSEGSWESDDESDGSCEKGVGAMMTSKSLTSHTLTTLATLGTQATGSTATFGTSPSQFDSTEMVEMDSVTSPHREASRNLSNQKSYTPLELFQRDAPLRFPKIMPIDSMRGLGFDLQMEADGMDTDSNTQ